MELKLTTLRALKFEEETGKDIVSTVKEIGETGEIKVKDIVALFKAMGENYTVEVFDAWDVPFVKKAEAVVKAAAEYIGGSAVKVQNRKK